MPTTWFFILLAVVAGAMMPTQAAVNNKLAFFVQHPVLAAFISFAVGTLALFLYILTTGIPLNQLAGAKNAPLAAWMGGICGAFFVAAVVVVVPRFGVALTFSLLIAGQMIATLPIDHFGFLGTPVREINLPRLLGVALVILGVILIRRF
jgi:transporter family-2 protein